MTLTAEQQRALVHENTRLRNRIRTMIYGDTRDPRQSQKAPDGGARLSDAELDHLHMMQRQGLL